MLVLDSDGVLDVDGLPPEIAVLVRDQPPEVTVEAPSGTDGLVGKPIADVERHYIYRRARTDKRQSRGSRNYARNRRTHALSQN
ncbi:MAG UNVERIFIED_CONTAM: hypothetical protein LVR18_10410 [Planctomycetaceae bacterium]